MNASQSALVLASLQAAVPATVLPFLSNDLDGLPIFVAASFTNFARVNVHGAEVSVQYFRSDRFLADVGYSRLVFSPKQNVSEEVISANAPAHSVTTGVTYSQGPASASFRYRWSDQFTWSGGAFRGPIPELNVFEVAASYRLGRRTTLVATVANLFDDSHYEISVGISFHGEPSSAFVRSGD